jgi:hypothetical protein
VNKFAWSCFCLGWFGSFALGLALVQGWEEAGCRLAYGRGLWQIWWTAGLGWLILNFFFSALVSSS